MPRLVKDETGTYMEIRWYLEDIQSVRPDLTLEQCETVLVSMIANHDCNYSVNWNQIHFTANFIYGESEDNNA